MIPARFPGLPACLARLPALPCLQLEQMATSDTAEGGLGYLTSGQALNLSLRWACLLPATAACSLLPTLRLAAC